MRGRGRGFGGGVGGWGGCCIDGGSEREIEERGMMGRDEKDRLKKRCWIGLCLFRFFLLMFIDRLIGRCQDNGNSNEQHDMKLVRKL